MYTENLEIYPKKKKKKIVKKVKKCSSRVVDRVTTFAFPAHGFVISTIISSGVIKMNNLRGRRSGKRRVKLCLRICRNLNCFTMTTRTTSHSLTSWWS